MIKSGLLINSFYLGVVIKGELLGKLMYHGNDEKMVSGFSVLLVSVNQPPNKKTEFTGKNLSSNHSIHFIEKSYFLSVVSYFDYFVIFSILTSSNPVMNQTTCKFSWSLFWIFSRRLSKSVKNNP